MSVRIRLQRHGSKKRPFYRLVAADQRSPRDGRYKEQLGTFNPLTEPNIVDLDLARVDYWLGVGAQPSETAASLIARARKGDGITNDAYIEASRKSLAARRDAALNAKPYVPEAPAAAGVHARDRAGHRVAHANTVASSTRARELSRGRRRRGGAAPLVVNAR